MVFWAASWKNMVAIGEQTKAQISSFFIHRLDLSFDQNYIDFENLLLFYFLQNDYSKRCKNVFKNKSTIWNWKDLVC